MAEIAAICISDVRGVQKVSVPEAELREEHGIVGDAHAGSWHRQVSLLGTDSVEKMRLRTDVPLPPGAFAENILVEGLRVYELPVGTRLAVGCAVCEVTQIGKECHADCAIRRAAGDCVMPREGIFVKVIRGGTIRPGDEIRVMPREEA